MKTCSSLATLAISISRYGLNNKENNKLTLKFLALPTKKCVYFTLIFSTLINLTKLFIYEINYFNSNMEYPLNLSDYLSVYNFRDDQSFYKKLLIESKNL